MHARARLTPMKALFVLALGLVALAATGGKAMADSSHVGAVYVQSNSIPNAVRVFHRSASGQLTAGPTVPTGGNGTMMNLPFGLAVTDSQNSVVLTQDNRVLLVSNNGSDTISSFRVLPDGNIVLADQESSRGDYPNSIAVTNGGAGRSLAYVLNEASETVSGFTVDRQGNLSAIPGSTRSVTGTFSATAGFNQDGHVLTVTNRNEVFGAPGPGPNGSISTFPVDSSTGLLGPERLTPATGTGAPFGFEYTKRDQLLVANSGQFNTGLFGSASSYELSKQSATLTPRDVKPTGGPLAITCWVAVTNNNKFAYFTSPGAPAGAGPSGITGFQVTHDSELVPIGQWNTQGSPLDIDTSVNSQYLYVLNTDLNFTNFAFTDSRVTAYEIDNSTGALTPIGSTPAGSGGNSGLAAY
jgi:6-phosphogluconolactonase